MKYYAKVIELPEDVHPYHVDMYSWPNKKEICLNDISKKWRIVNTSGWQYFVAENIDAGSIAVNERYGDNIMHSGSSEIYPPKIISEVYRSHTRHPLGIAIPHEGRYKILYLAGDDGIYRR